MEYAKEKGIEIEVTKEKPWSIDENLWSRSIEGGKLEDPWFVPPEDVYEWTKDPKDAPDSPEIIEISFEMGVPVGLNGEGLAGLHIIEKLNRIGGEHGIGRTDLIEDRILGLKARENYEHPAATILLSAHKALEQLVLTREELSFKRMVEERWSDLAYKGLMYDPLFGDLNAFIDKTQERVYGEIKVKIFKGNLQIVGRRSPYSLYFEDIVSFDKKLHKEDFSKYHGYQTKLFSNMMSGKKI